MARPNIIRDALAEKSYRIKQVNTLLNGQTVDLVEAEQVESPYPQVLYSGQDVIETILSEQVADRWHLLYNLRQTFILAAAFVGQLRVLVNVVA